MSKKTRKKRKKGFWYYVSVESPLDERQNLAATQINSEGVAIAFLLTIINLYIMEDIYKWCESYSAPTTLTIHIAGLYVIIKRGIKGCLFGIKGARMELLVMGFWIFIGITQIAEYIKFAAWKWFPEVTHDGMLTLGFCNQLMFLFMFLNGIAMLVFIIREKRAKKRKAESLGKEEEK